MHANNETGAMQPIREIAAHGARQRAPCSTPTACRWRDALPVNVRELGVDLYSISGHKFGAPKGIGALYVRKGMPLEPILFGGHHERDRRAGTENVPGASALGRAAGLAVDWSGIARAARPSGARHSRAACRARA